MPIETERLGKLEAATTGSADEARPNDYCSNDRARAFQANVLAGAEMKPQLDAEKAAERAEKAKAKNAQKRQKVLTLCRDRNATAVGLVLLNDGVNKRKDVEAALDRAGVRDAERIMQRAHRNGAALVGRFDSLNDTYAFERRIYTFVMLYSFQMYFCILVIIHTRKLKRAALLLLLLSFTSSTPLFLFHLRRRRSFSFSPRRPLRCTRPILSPLSL